MSRSTPSSNQYISQQLTDGLSTAIQEQDVLFTLFWINEMKDQGLLEQAINGKASSTGQSALSTLASSPFAPLRKIMIEILLLNGADSELKEAVELGMKKANWTILPILLDWSKGGSEEAKEARHLLSCTIDEAAIYLDKHLPSPPNPRGLTGYVEIPPPPSKVSSEAPSEVPVLPQSASTSRTSVAKTSTSPKIPSTAQNRPASSETSPRLAASKQSRTDPTATALPQPQTPKSLPFISNLLPFLWPNLSLPFPSPHPSLPPKPAVPEIPPQTKLSCATAPLPSKPQLICPSLPPKPEITLSYSVLTLSGIPSTSQQTDIEQLFKSAGIKAQVLFISSNYRPTLSIVRIPTDQASLCVQILEGSFFMGSKISCIGGPTKASLTVEPDTPSESFQLPSSPNRAPSVRPRRSRSRSRSPLRYDPSTCHGKYRRRSSQEHSKPNRRHQNPSNGGRRRWQHSWD